MASKFVSTAEICPVCNEKVYAMDRFVIEKMVIHKGCFKVRLFFFAFYKQINTLYSASTAGASLAYRTLPR